MSPRRHPIALPTTLLLVIALAGCPSDDNGDPPVKPKGEKLEPEPPGPPPPAPDPDVRLTCVGSNAPKAMKGAVLELVGYVRALSDPDAKKAPPKAQITAYSNEGKQLSKPVFADVQEGKDGRVTLPVPVKSEGFTGYAVVTHTGFLDWRLRNSRPLTTTEYDGWAWLTTPDEVKERGEALGITQSDDNGILLGAVHGIVEALFGRFVAQGMSDEDAFNQSTESITGPINRMISHDGILAVYNGLSDADRKTFARMYSATYPTAYGLLAEIYDEVASGNEIRSVIMAGDRLPKFPMGDVAGTRMWRVGETVRAARVEDDIPFNVEAAGVYCGTMMAQIDLLLSHGHSYSEVCNESVIEAVDSLNPYMHANGVDYMVDNCSTTARLGTRKWGPRFDHIIQQDVFTAFDGDAEVDDTPMQELLTHSVHDALATCSELRPAVDISVVL